MTDLQAYLLQITDDPERLSTGHEGPGEYRALITRLRAQYEEAVAQRAVHLVDAVAEAWEQDYDGH